MGVVLICELYLQWLSDTKWPNEGPQSPSQLRALPMQTLLVEDNAALTLSSSLPPSWDSRQTLRQVFA